MAPPPHVPSMCPCLNWIITFQINAHALKETYFYEMPASSSHLAHVTHSMEWTWRQGPALPGD